MTDETVVLMTMPVPTGEYLRRLLTDLEDRIGSLHMEIEELLIAQDVLREQLSALAPDLDDIGEAPF